MFASLSVRATCPSTARSNLSKSFNCCAQGWFALLFSTDGRSSTLGKSAFKRLSAGRRAAPATTKTRQQGTPAEEQDVGGRTMQRGSAKRPSKGKDLGLADEVRDLQRRQAERDGRLVLVA